MGRDYLGMREEFVSCNVYVSKILRIIYYRERVEPFRERIYIYIQTKYEEGTVFSSFISASSAAIQHLHIVARLRK